MHRKVATQPLTAVLVDLCSNVNATISGTKDTDCSVNVTVLDGGTAVGTASSTNAVNSAQANVVLTISPLPKLYSFRHNS